MAIRTVLVSEHFNVLHPGHLRLLRFAKEAGDRLLIAVESDRLAGKAAHVPEQLRLEGMLSNSYVDEAFLIDEPVVDVINRLKPDIVVKGKEHEHKQNPELEALSSYGGKLLFSSGETVFSSLDLIRREFGELSIDTISLPESYLARNRIEISRLHHILEGFGSLKVVVVGDLIVDEYISCEPLGMSQEDPTIVVLYAETPHFLAGRNSGKTKALTLKSLYEVIIAYLRLLTDIHIVRRVGATNELFHKDSATYRRMLAMKEKRDSALPAMIGNKGHD